MKLPTLYSRRADGVTIQIWEMEVEGNKFRTISGIIDGEKVVSEWTVAKAKNVGRANATTAEEQALLQAQSKWTKKFNEKYTDDISKIDVDRLAEPMRANDYYDRVKKLFNSVGLLLVNFLFAQPKLDGIRCVAKADGLWTRKGKPITSVPHIWEAIKHLFVENPNLILDGELYADKLNNDFQKICSIVRKVKPSKDELKEAEVMQYHVYDLPSDDRDFVFRIEALEKIVNKVNSDLLRLVPTYPVNNQQELDALYNDFLAAGYEGQMIRTNTPYEWKRTNALLKRKEFMDAEFIVDDVVEGVGNKSNKAGYVTLRNLDGTPVLAEDGSQAKAGLLGSWDYCTNLLNNRDKVIGTTGTVVFFGYGKTGAPRFPRLKAIRDYE
jgi:DNA ligase-1